MRYDLAFFLCCCKSFLGNNHNNNNNDNEEDFYSLLGVDRDASPEEVKRAYKRQSLQMHPDKLAQRGLTVTEADQARFTRMKEAYEILSDSHKRETYDSIGERGMKWLEEPFSMDPSELAHNFARSSVLDRSKIFAIFVAVAACVFMLPFLMCLHIDGVLGPNASWMTTLIPLWIWNVLICFYHVRVILMGPIQRPEHVPMEDWVDPLPMRRRYVSFGRFLLIALFELLAALKLDATIRIPWLLIFFPLYVWEATTLYKKWPIARMRIVTVEDLEAALGKSFQNFTPVERNLIGKRYSVVPSVDSPEMEAATKLKTRARHDIVKSTFRIVFCAVIIAQLDRGTVWNWWLVFLPFWFLTALICYANYTAFAEVHAMAMAKDPTLFSNLQQQQLPNDGKVSPLDEEMGSGGAGAGAGGSATQSTSYYGAFNSDGTTPVIPPMTTTTPLTDQEREELKATVMASSSRLCSKICSQGILLFVVMLFVAKLQGAGFSSLWIISPFLAAAGIILCCLGCAIFGITEVPTHGLDFDAAEFGGPQLHAQQGGGGKQSSPATAVGEGIRSNGVYVPPSPAVPAVDVVAVSQVSATTTTQTVPIGTTSPATTTAAVATTTISAAATIIHTPIALQPQARSLDPIEIQRRMCSTYHAAAPPPENEDPRVNDATDTAASAAAAATDLIRKTSNTSPPQERNSEENTSSSLRPRENDAEIKRLGEIHELD